jgi:predicted RNA-binding Zn ribbon-like protein
MTETDQQDFRDGVPFLGGSLWIDLLNTTPAIDGVAQDLLAGPGAVARWAGLAGLGLPEGATAEPGVLALRAALRLAFDAMAQGLPVPDSLRRAVNALLGGLRVTLALEDSGAGLALVQRVEAPLAPVAAQVALDFARFAEGYEAARLKHCANPACTMVFHDHGKNNRRRWCSMAVCGNRDKVASYRARKRGAVPG